MTTTNLGGILPSGEADATKVATYNEYLMNVLEPRVGWVGELTTNEVSITTTATLLATAFGKMHVITGTSADYTITLPTPVTADLGKIIAFRVSNAGTMVFTIDAAGSETIDGATSFTLRKDEVIYLKAVATTGNTWQTVGRSIPVSAWRAWTPTPTNLTLGNGVMVATYSKIGKHVECRLHIVFGSTTTVAGNVQFTLPITRATYAGGLGVTPLGPASAYDLSADIIYQCVVGNFSTTSGSIRVLKADATYLTHANFSSTIPFTWATGDEINAEFFYEAA